VTGCSAKGRAHARGARAACARASASASTAAPHAQPTAFHTGVIGNVIAIAAAARGSAHLIIFGLVLSVPIVMFGAGFLLKALERLQLLVWAGAGLLGWVSGEMMASDPVVRAYTQDHIDHATFEQALCLIGAGSVIAIAFIIKSRRLTRSHRAS
jgi:predicted tellurium resistance membrane protein TerC